MSIWPQNVENGERKILHKGVRLNLYRSVYISSMIKSRKLRWEGYVMRMEEDEGAFKILTAKPTEKRGLCLVIDGSKILE